MASSIDSVYNKACSAAAASVNAEPQSPTETTAINEAAQKERERGLREEAGQTQQKEKITANIYWLLLLAVR